MTLRAPLNMLLADGFKTSERTIPPHRLLSLKVPTGYPSMAPSIQLEVKGLGQEKERLLLKQLMDEAHTIAEAGEAALMALVEVRGAPCYAACSACPQRREIHMNRSNT